MALAIFLFSLGLFFLSGSATAYAYETNWQHAFTLDNKTGIFLINYSFGHGVHEVRLPVLAQKDYAPSENILSYSILDGEDEKAEGTSVAFVASNANLSDGMYVTPKGIKQSFTLAVFFTPTEKGLGDTYRMEVTHLPFNFDGTAPQSLNPSELQYYSTELLRLDDPTS